jgi:fatty-acid desaturase
MEPNRFIAEHDDIAYPSAIPFVLVHLACLAAFWTGISWQSIVIGVALYWLRMFAIGAGYHRYFSHRPRKAFCGGRPNIVIIICTRTLSETFTRHATKAFFTAILAGYSRAGMMRPTSSRLPTSRAIRN